MGKQTIADVEVRGRRVFMRVDFNAPLDDGHLTDDTRLRLALDSIHSVLDRGGRLVLASHLGRPEAGGEEHQMSLLPCARRLSLLLDQPVTLAGDCVGEAARQAVADLQPGQVVLLENLRFHEGEWQNAAAFAAELAEWADVYCHEAFAAAFRRHASLAALPALLRERGCPCVAGLHLAREIRYLHDRLANPRRPFVLVLGGDRAVDKLPVVEQLLDRLDLVLVGGAMALAFLAAEHKAIGRAGVERAAVEAAARVLHHAATHKRPLLLPDDYVCARDISAASPNLIAGPVIPPGWLPLDIGPRTVVRFMNALSGARTVLWTGPMGVCETHPFEVGTRLVGQTIAQAARSGGALALAAGASTGLAIRQLGLESGFAHLSVGAVATLAMLQGQLLPSVEALDDAVEQATPIAAGA